MNHSYRLVWNNQAQRLVPAPETARARGRKGGMRRAAKPIVALISALFATPSFAAPPPTTLPQGGQVVAGQASFATTGARLDITQTTPRAIIDWQSFNIGAAAQVNFTQPNSAAVALNRVLAGTFNASPTPSQIHGRLSANGQVFLVNPSGVLFAPGSQVDVGGLVASTLNIANDDFMAGRLRFERNGATGSIRNQGRLSAADGGYIALLAPEVINEGVVSARLGSVAFAAGERATLGVGADGRLSVALDPATVSTLVENRHLVQADGGTVLMSAQAAGTLLSAVVANPGAIEARTLENRAGRVLLLADMKQGEVRLSGSIDASAINSPLPQAGEGLGERAVARMQERTNGGFVETSAAHVTIADSARVTTRAAAGGTNGVWLIDPNDYTIAAAGGDISGATLSTNLAGGNVTILSSQGATAGNGDINVNDAVAWNANTLTLTAARDINLNAVMSASGSASLTMNTASANGGDGGVAGGTVKVGFAPGGGFAGRVDFPGRSGAGFLTINGAAYTVIDSLGAAGSVTASDLQGMSGDLTKNYALGSNIDATATSAWNAGAGFAPVGGDGAPSFTGRFDGLGHTINNLTINRPATENVGLFGHMGAGSAIRSVGMVGGSVSGSSSVGGLAGYNFGTISNSYTTGSVSGPLSVGGLVGLVGENGTISNSYATGSVNGDSHVGGLVGGNDNDGTISNSYATGSVSGSDWYAGGLTGSNRGTIGNSYATGSVNGGTDVGGLAGLSDGTISNSYATGSVSGGSDVGGLVGVDWGGSVTNSYWNTTTSGQAASAGGTGLTTAQMQQLANFPGWDISASGGSNAVWRIYAGQSAPLLRSFLTPATVTASAAAKTYDGNAWSGGNGITCSTGACGAAGYLGAVVYGGTSQGAVNAGSYAITPSGLYSNQQGYDISYADGALTVNPAAIVVAAAPSVSPLGVGADNKSKVYGSADPALTYSVTSGALQGGDSLSGSLARDAGENTGNYAIRQGSLSAGANYTLSFSNGALTITPAPLTVSANAASKTYDGLAYAGGNGVVYSGFVNNETSAVLGGTLAWGGSAQGATHAGSYAITPGGLTANNYTLSFVDGALTINKAPLTVSANAASKTYDGKAYSGGNGVAYSGFVNGESTAALGGTLAWGGSAQGATGAGSYAITPGGLTANNYTLSFVDGALTINKAPLTVSANNASKTYDGAVYSGGNGVAYSGFVNGESSAALGGSLAYGGTSQGATGAGSYTITPGGLTANNYTLSFADGALTINNAPPSGGAIANHAGNIYGDNGHASGNSVASSGFVNGETGAAQGITHGNAYPVTPSGLMAGNYTLHFVGDVLTVNIAPPGDGIVARILGGGTSAASAPAAMANPATIANLASAGIPGLVEVRSGFIPLPGE